MKSYQVVAKNTKKVMESFYEELKPLRSDSDYFLPNHLYWMLDCVEKNSLSSETKFHRWLGFVQGVLCYVEVLSVNQERGRTRYIFNGE